jgi:gliding motility-associated-like protein
MVPNAFTPRYNGNNNGYYDLNQIDNSIFFPIAYFVDEFHMMIFNRWGELVFETFDIKQGWDGMYRGQPAQQDVYVWKIWITFTDGTKLIRVGDVTLLR